MLQAIIVLFLGFYFTSCWQQYIALEFIYPHTWVQPMSFEESPTEIVTPLSLVEEDTEVSSFVYCSTQSSKTLTIVKH